eukprot:15462872-Alexandrium_andersonii.AAC.1
MRSPVVRSLALETPREVRRLRSQAQLLVESLSARKSGLGEGHFALLARSARGLRRWNLGIRF